MRGDVPCGALTRACKKLFSPHARGCSEVSVTPILSDQVFPACAGMFPIDKRVQSEPVCFPRMRGDVPKGAIGAERLRPFSPHARGCSCGGN